MRSIDPQLLSSAFGLGVAGNFAGHLEQAGEAVDFAAVATAGANAPKGIFPWYVPGDAGFLGTFPVTSDRLELPDGAANHQLQIEPEVGVIFTVAYDADGAVTALRPTAAGAFNDCSIRRPNATRISEKKNWGRASKGLASAMFDVADLDPSGGLRSLRIASFLRRAGTVHVYGIDSAAADYSYAGGVLMDWIIDRLRTQVSAPGTPLEDVGALLRAAGRPATLVVGIGATRYTDFGERTYLRVDDESIVVVYDGDRLDPDTVAGAVAAGSESHLEHASVLCQRVAVA